MRPEAESLIKFLSRAPTPWHAAQCLGEELAKSSICKEKSDGHPQNLWIDEGCLLASGVLPEGSGPIRFRIIAAHTDSPGLRLKPYASKVKAGCLPWGLEVYGGALLNSWIDRDLNLAGRVSWMDAGRMTSRLFYLNTTVMNLPQPAIHLNPDVNENGLKINPQKHLRLPFTLQENQSQGSSHLFAAVQRLLDIELPKEAAIEACLVDAMPASFGGLHQEWIHSGRLDDLAMCHAAVMAMLKLDPTSPVSLDTVPVLAFFNHEELGSVTQQGAFSIRLRRYLEELAAGRPVDWSASWIMSADMAHGLHPSWDELSEPDHAPILGGGPVFKINAGQRYAYGAPAQAYFQHLCKKAELEHQIYLHRGDMRCGHTVSSMCAAMTGIPAFDVGNPMWSMHSCRETAAVDDHWKMIALMSSFLRDS